MEPAELYERLGALELEVDRLAGELAVASTDRSRVLGESSSYRIRRIGLHARLLVGACLGVMHPIARRVEEAGDALLRATGEEGSPASTDALNRLARLAATIEEAHETVGRLIAREPIADPIADWGLCQAAG